MSGKRQRPADFDIDEHTLQYKNQPRQEEADKETDNIGERKILKIKRPENAESTSPSKVNFSLFGGNNAAKNQQDKEKQKQPKSEEKKEEKPSIFGNMNTNNGFGLFTSGSMFDNSKLTAPKLDSKPFTFEPKNSGPSIFNFSNNGAPPVKKDGFGSMFAAKAEQEEDGSGDSQQLQKDQENEIDPSKSSGKYEYKDQCEILYSEKAQKYKKDAGDLVENVEVVVKKEKQTKLNWIVVRLAATKNVIYTGVLVKGKTEAKNFGNKDENVSITAAKLENKEWKKNVLKIKFEKEDEGKKLLKVIEQLQ